MRNDLWVDFHRIDEDGLTLANARHARAGLNLFPGAPADFPELLAKATVEAG